MLFDLGFYITDSMGTLRLRNPEFVMLFDQISQQVYVVPNQMTVFLIHSQAPGPMSGAKPGEETRLIYYNQALDEVGFNARDLKADLDRELKFIWNDLQKVIIQEEIAADTG